MKEDKLISLPLYNTYLKPIIMKSIIKIIVAGSRQVNNYEAVKFHCEEIIKQHYSNKEIVIVSGIAQGADKLGEQFAEEYNYKVDRYPADWVKHGRSAGYKRNMQMAMNADVLIAFWYKKSKGTGHMIDIALLIEMPTYVIQGKEKNLVINVKSKIYNN